MAVAADWKPAAAPLMTKWGKQVTPENAWREYPRPQLVRKEWQNLNGLWDYAITAKDAKRPEKWDGQILVPFCPESALSGVGKGVKPSQALWYRRTFSIDAGWNGKRVLLHFGAVDWEATVFVNGKELPVHRGGSDPFSFDITDSLKAGENELVVKVWDPTDTGSQPRGKQQLKPEGIWYTPVTGIWQTVWLEPVEKSVHITGVKFDIDHAKSQVSVQVETTLQGGKVHTQVEILDGDKVVAESKENGTGHVVTLENPKHWSPDSPHLYTVRAKTAADGGGDAVESYFAFRTITIGADGKGVSRMLLNGKPVFQYGPLDQGWWPDGLLTPPSDAAMKYDLEVLKKLGFNMLRKHIKVEPDRYYYHTDRLGLLVWQDMPSGMMAEGRYKERSSPQHVMEEDAAEMLRRPESAAQFELELREMMDELHDFPSIVTWVVMNEGWGQYDTERLAADVKAYDPSRLVNAASGWRDVAAGDFIDQHTYDVDLWDRTRDGRPNLLPDPAKKRVAVVGEFGGLGYPVEGHLWQTDRNWGYQTYHSPAELLKQYGIRLEQIQEARTSRAIWAGVYTQTTDVEGEVNGLLTYDREVVKLDPAALRALHAQLYRAPGR
jgi:beta-galactosidase/beta-glucuronidase